MDLGFFKGKRVLVTGHTGFKGSWLSRILINAGAQVWGYSLGLPSEPALYELAGLDGIEDIRGDIRDLERLKQAFAGCSPQVVFHLAAQPIVRASYRNPLETFGTNVMGTVNLLECIRLTESVKSAVIITTDKVYKNKEWAWGYRENEPLDGFDPYSNSKSCADLAVHSYRSSFFGEKGPAVSAARAGNVLGGGDFAADRIIPDCFRAVSAGKQIVVRNPFSTRPYQHVIEPLSAYLLIAQRQWEDRSLAGEYNVGPEDCDAVTTGEIVTSFCETWNRDRGELGEAGWRSEACAAAPHEASFLKLDSSKIRTTLGWKSRWHIDKCMEETVTFYKKLLLDPSEIPEEMDAEIFEYFGEMP